MCALWLSGSSDIIISRQRGPTRLMDGTLHSPRDLHTSHPNRPSSHCFIKTKRLMEEKRRDGQGSKGKYGRHKNGQVVALRYQSLCEEKPFPVMWPVTLN